MSNEIIRNPDHDFDADGFDRLTPDEQVKAFVEAFTAGIQSLKRSAEMLLRMQANGVNLDAIPKWIAGAVRYLTLIGQGQLLTELYSMYEERNRLKFLATLPISVQQQIVDGESFPVVVLGNDGRWDKRMFPADKMTDRQCKQVFGVAGVKSEAEQIAALEDVKLTEARRPPKKKITPDHVRDLPDDKLDCSMGFDCSEEEKRMIRAFADDVKPGLPTNRALRLIVWNHLRALGYRG